MPENVPDIFGGSPARSVSPSGGGGVDLFNIGSPTRTTGGTGTALDLYGSGIHPAEVSMPDPSAGESFGNMFLDMLALPEIAFFDRSIRGAVYAIGKNEGIEGVIKRFVQGSPFVAALDFFGDNDKNGWFHHENISGGEMLKAWGVKDPGFLASTLAAIATGPSTYIGLGGLTKLGKAFRAGQIYIAGADLAAGAEGLLQIQRGEKLLQMGTAEQIIAAGGKIQGKASLKSLSLAQQAEHGIRGMNFGFREWTLWAPKNINIPLYNAAETIWEGVARSKVAQAIRPILTPLPIIGKSFAGANDANITATSTVDAIMRTELAERNALAASWRETVNRGLGAIMGAIPDGSLKDSITGFTEIMGIDAIDAIRTPEGVAAMYSQRIAKLFGVHDEAAIEGIRAALTERMTKGLVDDAEAITLANSTVKKILHTVGLTDDPEAAAEAYSRYYTVHKDVRESYLTIRDMLRVQNVDEAIPTTFKDLADYVARNGLDEKTEGALKNYIGYRQKVVGSFDRKYEAAQRAARQLGLFSPGDGSTVTRSFVDLAFENAPLPHTQEVAERLETIYDYFNSSRDILGTEVALTRKGQATELASFGELMAGGIQDRAESIASLTTDAREALAHGAQGYRSIVERVAQNISKGADRYKAFKELGGTAIDPKAKSQLTKAFEKVSRILTRKDAPIASDLEKGVQGAPLEQQIVYNALKRGSEATTYSDLVGAAIFAVDDLNQFHLAAENAAGVATAYTTNYIQHQMTAEGRDLINQGIKGAAKGNSRALAMLNERELTDMTIGEANALFKELGMKATHDAPAKILNDAYAFGGDLFRKADADFFKKLRKVDPESAAVFEANALAIQMQRATASGQAIATANFHTRLFSTMEQGGLAAREWNIGSASSHAQTYAEMEQALKEGHTIVNVNDILKPQSMRPRDILAEAGVMRSQGVDDVARHGLLSDVEAITEAQATAKRVQEFLPGRTAFKEGERYVAIDKTLFLDVMDANAKLTSPLYMSRTMQMMHKATNYWKMWTLNNPISTFAFNARNFIGDLFLAGIGGMGPKEGFDAFKDIGRVMKAAAGVGKEGLLDILIPTVEGKTITGADLVQMMKGQGVWGHGAHVLDSMAGAEISAAQKIDQTVRDWIPGFSGSRNKWLKPGEMLTENQSSWTRGAFFLDQLRKGADPLEAARMTKKYLLDYSSDLLTHTERSVFKLAVPFYTFMRRSIPAVLEGLVASSSKFATMEKFIRNVGESSPELAATKELPDTLVPDYVKEMYGVPYKIDEQGNPSYFMLKSWLPGGDIAEIADAVRNITSGKGGKKLLDSITARVNPIAKVGVEMLANYSFFTGKPIERYDGQQQEMFGEPWSAKTAYLLRQIRFVNEIDKLNPVGAERTGLYGSRAEVEDADRVIGFLSGVKPAVANIPAERQKAEYEIEKAIRDTKGEIRRVSRNVGAVGQQKELDALRATLRKHYSDMLKTNLGYAQFRKTIGIDQ